MKREHTCKSTCQHKGKRSGVFTGGRTRNIPKLLKPLLEVSLVDLAQLTLLGVGLRYPPGFLCISMNSMSFLIMAFGSYGLPRNLPPLDTS